MRRQALIGALLLVGAGVVLGATVFRADIAQATGLAQAVTVDNTTANPVPVQEQRVDATGNIKVHEQGTANVNVTNTSLSLAPRAASTFRFGGLTAPAGGDGHDASFSILASEVIITPLAGRGYVDLDLRGKIITEFPMEPGDPPLILPFTQPVPVDEIAVFCRHDSSSGCGLFFTIIGDQAE